MRNKSRKRILHEQRVEIAKLRRDKAFLQDIVRRMSAERIPPEIITYSVFVNDSDNGKLRELLFANVGERIIRDIVRAIIRSNTMQIVTTPITESGGTKITFTLKLLRSYETDIDPCEVFKDIERVDFREPEILYGGPHRGGEMLALGQSGIDPRLVFEDGYELPKAFRKDAEKVVITQRRESESDE